MRKYSIFLLFLVALLSGCKKDKVVVAIPVIKSLAEIRNSVQVTSARTTNADGKVYVTAQYLFYIAQESGVHIFDNHNPASPQNIAFIQIEGVHDIAVKGNYLFADNYIDLLVFNIADINNITLVKIVERAFNFYPAMPMEAMFFDYDKTPGTDELVVGYRLEMREMKRNRKDYMSPEIAYFDLSNSAGGAVGVGGSYARFQINNNALYAVESYQLNVFNITQPVNTVFDKAVYMTTWLAGGEFETLFKQGELLFIGATNGMYIVNAEDEFNPFFVSSFSHATACDPVVVDGNTAYITVRGGNSCGAIDDQINVIDITSLNSPSLLSTYLLSQPMGLGIRNGELYVCNTAGLNVFDATNSNSLLLKQTYDDKVTDVIPLNSHLIAVGKNKLIQYAYGDNFTLSKISTVNF